MQFYEHKFKCLGTTVTIKFWQPVGLLAQEVMQLVINQFMRFQETYSRFLPTSKLSKVNAHFADPEKEKKPIKVDSEFAAILTRALKLAEYSNGAFDPTIYDLLVAHGYENSFNAKEIQEKADPARADGLAKTRPTWQEVTLQVGKQEGSYNLTLAANQKLDFGGIGKGWVIDLAAVIFRKYQVENFLIDAGGDISGAGTDLFTEKPWQIDLALTLPNQEPKYLHYYLNISGESVACSGVSARRAGKFHHLLDPKTGQPVNEVWQTFISAPDATTADTLTTLLSIMGPDSVDKLCQDFKVEAMYVAAEGKLYASDNFRLTN